MTPTLIHHAANRGHHYPPGFLGGLRFCPEAGARFVEIDITPLAGDDFALLHDGRRETATDGRCAVSATTAGQAIHLHYTAPAAAPGEPVGLLSQAIALLRDHPCLEELQLDLKVHSALGEATLRRLLRQIEPVQSRIRVTSVADRALRHLRRLSPDLRLGFDPLLYLDLPAGKVPQPPPTVPDRAVWLS